MYLGQACLSRRRSARRPVDAASAFRFLGDPAARRRRTDRGWLRQRPRPLSVARAIYLGLSGDAKLWLRGREFVDIDRKSLAALLGAA